MEELVNSWKIVLLSVMSSAAFLIGTWLRLKEGWFRLKQRRTRSLLRLLKDERWRTASSAELQLAAEEAWGQRLDNRVLHFALARHNAITLVDKVLLAGNWIRFRDDQSGFDEDRLVSWLSIKYTQLIANVAALTAGAGVTIGPIAVLVITGDHAATIVVAAFMMGLSWLTLKCAASLEAATIVLSLHLFPPQDVRPPTCPSLDKETPMPTVDRAAAETADCSSQVAIGKKPATGRKRKAATVESR